MSRYKVPSSIATKYANDKAEIFLRGILSWEILAARILEMDGDAAYSEFMDLNGLAK